jgi:biopolymer transport protein ExbD
MQSSAAKVRAGTARILVAATLFSALWSSAQTPPSAPPEARVWIAADGVLTWNSKPVTKQELDAAMRAAAKMENPPILTVRAEEKVTYGAVMEVFTLARGAGLQSKLVKVDGGKE